MHIFCGANPISFLQCAIHRTPLHCQPIHCWWRHMKIQTHSYPIIFEFLKLFAVHLNLSWLFWKVWQIKNIHHGFSMEFIFSIFFVVGWVPSRRFEFSPSEWWQSHLGTSPVLSFGVLNKSGSQPFNCAELKAHCFSNAYRSAACCIFLQRRQTSNSTGSFWSSKT